MTCDVVWSTSMHETHHPKIAMGVAKHGHDGSRVWVFGSWWVCATRRFQKKTETSVTFKITVDLIAHRIALHQYG